MCVGNNNTLILALLPSSNIELQFEVLENQMRYVLSRNLSIRSKGKEFLDYFRKTYLNPECRYPKSMWNHWDNHGDRTNNRLLIGNNMLSKK